ncbi:MULTISPECIES: disulfide bond formation protein B [Brucella]|uniref:Disulfide bond formation DsbB family protein n=2 Tax=Brucella pseudogrignonensis TaxID=419475 RepID=A0A256GUC3_9HYPH|nr:disulfide bond formation protein B [Brucella pseudogrignonensis]EMG54187.1 disulfide bond formation protein DsbB [Ochrobactrum sp. CDB2]OYR30151.1 disulfide bond formation DsbB family protein [Brucella pseudogrignonensis]PQZ43683.1 disulfide bond formation protein B [Brucella pseudogrignonensis]PRA43430.1 disulfide bond formation protein B [Brucella pseudogrignonensis]PRA72100.1 disulfide bond formation protein B [Brucella pseudogrignonensis]
MSVFTSDNEIDKQQTLATLLSIYLLGMMAVIAAILTAAMVLQYANGEIPCPLCLLQRVAMFGVCFGIILQFRHGFSYRNTGMSMIFSLFLLIVSVRQTLLDIYPRPGHEYIGTSVFGLHMPVWSILIAVALLIAFAFQLILWGGSTQLQHKSLTHQSLLRVLATALSLYVIAIGVINFVSVGVQCGIDECHTFGYALLK